MIDSLDAAFARLPRREAIDAIASELDPAKIGAVYARHVFDQGRFAGAVVAHQRQHFARHQRQIDATEHLDRAEAFSQALNGERPLHLFFGLKRRMSLADKEQ